MDTGLTPVVPSFDGPTSSEAVHELRSLETLECYKLVARLGRGGMAEVLLAALEVEPFVHRPVVVKRLYEHFAEDPNLVQMFLDEAGLLRQLEHPHIVKTYEAGVIDGQCCIAMEYLEGEPLQIVIRRAYERGKLPVELAVYIVIGMLEGLHYAHDARDERGRPLEVVHRDVSPQNVFITSSGVVKILDFGIAKTATQAGRTAAGMVKGKVGYMAPEQASGGSLDRRADVWSAGVVLWEALTGNRLFKAENDAAAIHLMLTGDIPRASTLRAEVPPELDAVILRALRRDPSERYRSALEMLRELKLWLAGCGHPNAPVALRAFMNEAFTAELLDQRLLVSAQMARSDCTPSSARSMDGETTAKVGHWGVVAPDPESLRPTARPPAPEEFEGLRPDRSRALLMLLVLFASAALASFVIAKIIARPDAQAAMVSDDEDVLSPAPRAASPAPATAPASSVTAPEPTAEPPAARARSVMPAAASAVAGGTGTVVAPPLLLQHRLVARLGAPATAAPAEAHGALEPADRTPPKAAPAEPADAFGYLTIDTAPWSYVSTGGRLLGQTPLVGVKLSAGVHVLSFKNPDIGRETSYTVTIEPGKTVARRVGLE